MIRVRRIVSGGQTGADQGGLDAALALGIPHGGWCPLGRLAEDGPIPNRYQLTETDSPITDVRTERNVVDSDGTLLLTFGPPTGGSALTAELAEARGKPLLALDLAETPSVETVERIRAWLTEAGIETLNVAGSRESENPGLHDAVRDLLIRTLSP